MVILSTGRNDIATAQVKLSAPSGIQFKYEEAELSGDGERTTTTAQTAGF